MYSLSAKDLQTLSGLSATIIRIWKSRHGLLRPVLPRQKIRHYSDEDIKRLLRLSILYNQGWKTTELATLAEEEIVMLVKNGKTNKQGESSDVQRLLLAAIDLNESAFKDAFNTSVAALGFKETISSVVNAYLSCLDVLSNRDGGSAQMQFSVHLLKSWLITASEQVPPAPHTSPLVALCSPVEPGNGLPLLYLNYLLRKSGCNVLYLGQQKKLNNIAQATKGARLHALWIHVGNEPASVPVDDYLSSLRQAFPSQTIIVSGAALEANQRAFVNVHLLHNDAAIEAFINAYPFGST